MVFQDPMTSLNPVVTVGIQVEEVHPAPRERPTSARPVTGPRTLLTRSASPIPAGG